MSREVAYLFQAYSRHPRAPRRIAAAADAHGHFAAAFTCTDLRSATRELLRSLLANPIAFLACLERHSADATIKFLEQLGGEAEGKRGWDISGRSAAATCRSSAYRIVARAALRDPVAWLQATAEVGLPRLVTWVRQLPLANWSKGSSITTRTPLVRKNGVHARKLRHSRLFLNLNAIFRHPLNRA